jgi:hypothetical protein
MSSVVAHKNLTDAQNYFMTGGMAAVDFSQGEIPGLNFFSQLSFPVAFTGHKGREFPGASCVCETPLPLCLQVGLPFGGRINDRNGKTLCFKMKQSHLKTS